MPRNLNWPTANPGRFIHKLTLLEEVDAIGAAGTTTSFLAGQPAITIMADVEFVRGIETIRGGQDVSQTYFTATSWFHPKFTSQERIQIPDGSIFIIQSVNNLRLMGIFMELTCQQLSDGGCS